MLSAWHGATKTGVKVSDCTVHVAKTRRSRQVRDAPPGVAGLSRRRKHLPKRAIYRFTDTAGAHHALTSAEYDAARRDGAADPYRFRRRRWDGAGPDEDQEVAAGAPKT